MEDQSLSRGMQSTLIKSISCFGLTNGIESNLQLRTMHHILQMCYQDISLFDHTCEFLSASSAQCHTALFSSTVSPPETPRNIFLILFQSEIKKIWVRIRKNQVMGDCQAAQRRLCRDVCDLDMKLYNTRMEKYHC